MRHIILINFLLILLVFTTFNSNAQILPSEKYKSSPLSVGNFKTLADEERNNPPIIIKKRIGNKKSNPEEYNLPIPPDANYRKFNIEVPKNTHNKDGDEDEPNSPVPTLNFLGLDDSGTSIPPDTHGAT